MDCCCCTKPRPAPATFRRYRRSTVTKAPRKRTFIANMQKFLIDYQMPSGLAGESFFGASTLCQVPLCRTAVAGQSVAAPLPAYETVTAGNGGGNGRARPGFGLGGDDGGNNEGVDSFSALPIVVAAALSIALYPALEFLAPPAMEAVTMVQPQDQPQAHVVEELDEPLTLDSIQRAIDTFIMGDAADGGEMAAEAAESKLAMHMG